jgi:hypothetical protein
MASFTGMQPVCREVKLTDHPVTRLQWCPPTLPQLSPSLPTAHSAPAAGSPHRTLALEISPFGTFFPIVSGLPAHIPMVSVHMWPGWKNLPPKSGHHSLLTFCADFFPHLTLSSSTVFPYR